MIIICTTTWMGDGGGYIIGRILGGKIFYEMECWRFIRAMSPSKTIEGSLGYLAFSLTFAYISTFFYHKISFEKIIVLGFICGIFGQIGDLVESAFKRRKGIKD
ncbi:MAG: phosphatidate cytidylyltransferase, partial [Ignavibacteriota bacterium]